MSGEENGKVDCLPVILDKFFHSRGKIVYTTIAIILSCDRPY